MRDRAVIKNPTCVSTPSASPTSLAKYMTCFLLSARRNYRECTAGENGGSEVPPRDVLDADVIHQLILLLIIIKASRDTYRFQRELNGAVKSKLQRIQKYLKLQK